MGDELDEVNEQIDSIKDPSGKARIILGGISSLIIICVLLHVVQDP